MFRSPGAPLTRLARPLSAAIVSGVLLVIVTAGPAFAQLAPISFPDTQVGSTSTVKCPTTSVTDLLRFELLRVGHRARRDRAERAVLGRQVQPAQHEPSSSPGSCEAHPVTLPATVGPGQVLAYQATFAPTAAGTFNGSLTINTGVGPAVVNLSGKATASGSGGQGRAFVAFETNGETFVPGAVVDVRFRTRPQTLQGQVDLYVVIQIPTGQTFFISETGALVPDFAPFRRNVTVLDEQQPLFQGPLLGIPFGNYIFLLALGHAGVAPDPANLAPFLAANIAQTTVTYAPLSLDQQAVVQARGKPDILSSFWIDGENQKSESWLYLSTAPPTRYRFLNGVLQGQESAPDVTPGVGPKFDPAIFTPQLTEAQLTEKFGQPTSTQTLPGGLVVLTTTPPASTPCSRTAC